MSVKTYPIFLASSYELQPEREKFGNFINSVNKNLQKKNVFLRLEVWEDMDDSFNTTCKQEDYNEYLAKCSVCVVLFWTKVGKYTMQEYEFARKLSLESKLRLYVYEKKAEPLTVPSLLEKESKERFLNLLQECGKEQFQGQFESYSELENRFKKMLDGLFDAGILAYGEKAKMLSSNGPIEPNPFIGREEELKTMEERFEKTGQTLLIHSEGGMGKTTLASKYWYNSEFRYSYQCWLFCDLGVMDSVKSLAPMLGLDAKKFSKLDLQEQVSFLKTAILKLKGDFLVVLDNANDAAQIQEFLRNFRGFSWNVLITSRCREVLKPSDEIYLTHLDPKDAKTLFRNFYSEETEEFNILLESLLKAIHYHTLVVEVFSKNLKSANEYFETNLQIFLESLEEKGLVLDNHDNFEVITDWDDAVQKPASTTNEILEILYDFSKLSEEERVFMVNLSLIPSENYSLKLFLGLFGPENNLEKIRAFGDILKSLYRKGWIGATLGDKPLYRLSPIIQGLVQIKNSDTLWEDGQALFLRLKEHLKYEQEKDNTHTKFKRVPFGRYFVGLFKENYQENFLSFLNNLALVLRHLGGEANLLEAKFHLEKALSSDIQNFGEDSPQVATGLSNLATVLLDLGGDKDIVEAKIHLEKALSIDIANYGENAQAVTRERVNLASALRILGGQNNLIEAKNHLEKAITTITSNIGEYAFEIAIIQSNLALVLVDLGEEGNLLEARSLLEKAVSSDITIFGGDAPATSRNRSHLAHVLKSIGGEKNLLEAKVLLEKTLSSIIRNFGEDYRSVAKIRSDMAEILAALGGEANLLAAKYHLEKALHSEIQNFGEDSISTASYRSILAMVLRDLGGEANLLKAKEQFEKLISSNIRNFGEDSHELTIYRSILALVLRDLGGEANLLEAKGQYEKILSSGIRNYGEDSPALATRRSNFALVLHFRIINSAEA